jgi:formylglycine-generating enzyme required for sulfatase activity/tRNA A-37 threonylcarbamoyl transferase component Bud32
MPLNTGQVLQNRYRIEALLGQGGMGAVYRAYDLRLHKVCALKELVPPPGLSTDEIDQLRHQFRRESQVLAHLGHPNIPRVIDHFAWGASEVLIMDYVEGESLETLMQRAGALREEEVLRWADQLLDALSYCHSEGVLHRDIKPANILITPEQTAMLVDFGLTKLWNPAAPGTMTVLRGMGTPAYAPPEQYGLDPGHTDARSDLYALGATLYHALTGGAPPTAMERMARPEAFAPPRASHPRISPQVEEAILRAMELPIERRFQSAAQMRAALAKRPAKATRSRAGRWAVVGITLLALALGTVLTLLSGQGDSAPPTEVAPTASTAPPTAQPGTSTALPLPSAAELPTDSPAPTGPPSPTPNAGEARVWPRDGAEMVYVPAGDFVMGNTAGDPYEQPEHSVYLDAFWIDRYEVTNRQFREFVAETGHVTTAEEEGWSHVWTGYNAWEERARAEWRQPAGPGSTISDLDDHPVVAVSWYDAQAYCQWAGRRLATEAEWEKAARGRQGQLWAWGDVWICGGGNFDDETQLDPETTGCHDGFARTAPVGQYEGGQSPYGAFDLSGNVSEWTADWYAPFYYATSPSSNPMGPETGIERVLRGGGWFSVQDFPASRRRAAPPEERVESVGFRCASSGSPPIAPLPSPVVTPTPTSPPPTQTAIVRGSSLVRLSSDPASEYVPSYSPNGDLVVYMSNRDGPWQIYLMNADGSNAHRLTKNDADNYHPRFSPNGQQIAFASTMDGDWDIYLMDLEGQILHQVTNQPGDQYYPHFSPDGSTISFMSNTEGAWEVFLTDTAGSYFQNVTNHPADDGYASFAPDGRHLVLQSNRDGNWEIYSLNLDNGATRRLTNDPSRDADPVVSPDGQWIAFESNRSGSYDIVAMDWDGAQVRRLTTDAANDWVPAFAPDGSGVIFQSDRSGAMDLYVIPFVTPYPPP